MEQHLQNKIGISQIVCVSNFENTPTLGQCIFGTFAAFKTYQHILQHTVYFACRQCFDMLTGLENIKCAGGLALE